MAPLRRKKILLHFFLIFGIVAMFEGGKNAVRVNKNK